MQDRKKENSDWEKEEGGKPSSEISRTFLIPKKPPIPEENAKFAAPDSTDASFIMTGDQRVNHYGRKEGGSA